MRQNRKSIAVLRRGRQDSSHLIAWLKSSRYQLTDVCKWEEVQILELNYAGDCRAYLAGKPLHEFDTIFYVGTPGAHSIQATSLVEGWYRNAERSAAILAALSGVSGPRVFNRGNILLWGRQIADPLVMLRCLAGFGWKTPAIDTKMVLGDDHIDGDLTIGASRERECHPEPKKKKRLAIFSRWEAPFVADAPGDRAPEEIACMNPATQTMLRHLDLDCATIAVANFNGVAYAFGIKPELPCSLPNAIALRALMSHRESVNQLG